MKESILICEKCSVHFSVKIKLCLNLEIYSEKHAYVFSVNPVVYFLTIRKNKNEIPDFYNEIISETKKKKIDGFAFVCPFCGFVFLEKGRRKHLAIKSNYEWLLKRTF